MRTSEDTPIFRIGLLGEGVKKYRPKNLVAKTVPLHENVRLIIPSLNITVI